MHCSTEPAELEIVASPAPPLFGFFSIHFAPRFPKRLLLQCRYSTRGEEPEPPGAAPNASLLLAGCCDCECQARQRHGATQLTAQHFSSVHCHANLRAEPVLLLNFHAQPNTCLGTCGEHRPRLRRRIRVGTVATVAFVFI